MKERIQAGGGRCPEVNCTEQVASHTFESAGALLGSEGAEIRDLPPEVASNGAAVMVGLPRGVAKRLLSNTLNSVEARTTVQGSDISLSCFRRSPVLKCLETGIELKGMFCCQEGWDPRNVATRDQFWETRQVQKPDLIIHECPGVLGRMSWEGNGDRLKQCCRFLLGIA